MSKTMTLRNDNGPWYKERWPWFLMAGPTIVIIAGLTTAYLAVISNDGLVTDDYYKQGLAVNQTMERDHAAGNLGLQADIMRADQNLRLMIRADESTKLPAAITLKLAHPTRAGHDQVVQMAAESNGFYTGKMTADIRGRWYVSIEDPAGKWRLQGEWLADSGEPLRLIAKMVK